MKVSFKTTKGTKVNSLNSIQKQLAKRLKGPVLSLNLGRPIVD